MKKLIIAAIPAIFMASLAFANTYLGPTNLSKQTLSEVVIHGPAELQGIKAKSLSVMGPLQFKDLQVDQSAEVVGPVSNSENGKFNQVKVTGPFQAKQVTASNLQVIGPVQVNNLTVSGDTIILGPLTTQNSKLGNLTITADKISLTDTVVNNIYVKKTDDKQPTLTLAGKTVVSGSIQFESKNGIVVKQGQGVDIKGQIIGGEVKK